MPFTPIDLIAEPKHEAAFDIVSSPTQPWTPILATACSFSTAVFDGVMLNLVKNPNHNSSCVFRADIVFDSGCCAGKEAKNGCHVCSGFPSAHSAAEESKRGYDTTVGTGREAAEEVDDGPITIDSDCAAAEERGGSPNVHVYTPKLSTETVEARPWVLDCHGFRRTRTIVRRMIPRNPQLDRSLVQTCHFFTGNVLPASDSSSTTASDVERLVVYIPHVSAAEDIPYYHPTVRAIAFLFTGRYISVHYAFFSSVADMNPRLRRMANNLLQTLHKHGHGTAAGYVKRVHHDLIVPQARYQDTYTRLKAAHAKRLLENWVEVTDPTKHVFEDLGIAAFLIELWQDMYGPATANTITTSSDSSRIRVEGDDHALKLVPPESFPGFVDLGCGNGVLVEILSREGWKGWGFDARRRKTWSTLAVNSEGKLQERILLPAPLASDASTSVTSLDERRQQLNDSMNHLAYGAINPNDASSDGRVEMPFHNGLFPKGTFLISNHGDELTGWTPILASLAEHAPFLVIPCCSHDLSGARFRAPDLDKGTPLPKTNNHHKPTETTHPVSASTPSPSPTRSPPSSYLDPPPTNPSTHNTSPASSFPPESAARKTVESGVIGKPTSSSTYAALVAWTANVADCLGYVVEREVLRIPSTRNVALLGRRQRRPDGREGIHGDGGAATVMTVPEVIEKFGGGGGGGKDGNDVRGLAEAWLRRATTLSGRKSGTH